MAHSRFAIASACAAYSFRSRTQPWPKATSPRIRTSSSRRDALTAALDPKGVRSRRVKTAAYTHFPPFVTRPNARLYVTAAPSAAGNPVPPEHLALRFASPPDPGDDGHPAGSSGCELFFQLPYHR